jgi:hypothetical protein
LDDMKANAKAAGKITMICLAVTMPHQISYLLGLVPMHLGFSRAGAESLAVVGLAIGLPIAGDWLILTCIRALTGRAASTRTQVVSAFAMLGPSSVSGWLNFSAPNPRVIQAMFVVAVAYIPLSHIVRVVADRPDFRKVDRIENEGTAQFAEPVKARQTVRSGQRPADKARRLARKNPALTVAELVKVSGCSRGTARKILDELASPTRFLSPAKPSVVPVSPAPAGR